jgi:hypothetical protein
MNICVTFKNNEEDEVKKHLEKQGVKLASIVRILILNYVREKNVK